MKRELFALGLGLILGPLAGCTHHHFQKHCRHDILRSNDDLGTLLSFITSAQDLVCGLVFSLHFVLDININVYMEVAMKTNLLTVLEAVTSECAFLWGIKHRASRTGNSRE